MPLPRWLVPANPRRVWVLLGLGTVLITWRLLAAQGYLEWNSRIQDKLHALSIDDRRKLNAVLGWLYEENGVDARIELVPDLAGEPIEHYTVRRMRQLNAGGESDRRGLLVVYDRSSGRVRMEVGPTLEGVLTDAFVGHINRENLSHYLSVGKVRDGVYTTLFMILDRLREATLGNDFDPRVLAYVEDMRRLALGAGQTTRLVGQSNSSAFGVRQPTAREREYFSPRPTVQAAYDRYHEWLAYGGQPNEVPLFTATSAEWFDDFPNTAAFAELMLMEEYGHAYRIDERGKLAMLYYTDSPFAQPHFFRRGRGGWQLDLIAEILNTRNTIGGGYSWTLWNSGDDFFRAFRDRWVDYNGGYRPAGGDNRQLPTSGADAATMVQEPLPIARSDTFMEHLTVIEAADRIRTRRGTPTLVILYETWSEDGRAMLPGLARLADSAKTAGLPFLAFSMDQEEELLRRLPPRLRELGSPFPAVHLYHWWPGMLAGAWTSAGIPLDIQFDIPVVALVSSDGEFLGGTQGRVPPLSQLLERLPGGH